MKIIGVTGVFGSGKSLAARIFADEGAYLIDHDMINHGILKKGQEGHTALVSEYGVKILNDNGEIDRAKVAAIVFSDGEKVKRIEEILHPIIIRIEQELVSQYKQERKYDYIIFDTPLLFEAGRDKVCDYTVVISADEDIIYERIVKKFGIKPEDAKKRMSFQLSMAEKIKLADYVIENNSTVEDLKAKVIDLFNKIKGERKARP